MTAITRRMIESVRTDELPQNWHWMRLGDVCERVTGTRDPRRHPDDSFLYVDISSVDNVSKRIVEARKVLGKDAPSRARQVIRAGDVIVSTTRPNLNAVAQVPPELEGQICSTGFCVLRPTSSLDAAYLFGFVQSREFVTSLSNLVKGALYPAVTDGQVYDQYIPVPPFTEQQRIATLLAEKMAAVDTARAAAEAQLSAIKQLPASYLRAAFSGAADGDFTENEEGLRSRTSYPLRGTASDKAAVSGGLVEAKSPLPEGWRWARLGEICSITARQVDPKIVEFGALPHVNGENILSGLCRMAQVRTATEDGMTSGKYLFNAGDVLYSKLRPYLRKAVVVDFIGVCSADMYPIRVNQEVLDAHFLAWTLVSDRFTHYANEESHRARMPKLNREQLFAWQIPLPPLSVQVKIAARLADRMAGTELTQLAAEGQLATINKLPAALLREAFSGKM